MKRREPTVNRIVQTNAETLLYLTAPFENHA